MRTNLRTSGTTGQVRRAPVATTLAALCLAIPMVAAFGGTAFASVNESASTHGNSGSAPGQVKKQAASDSSSAADASAAKPADFIGPVAPVAETVSTTTTAAALVTAPTGSDHSQGSASTTGVYNQPQPLSNADMNKGGANNGGDCGAYCSTRDGSPSLNGNGGGNAHGKPCAGCVGKADNKNPPGQAPNGSDHNNGYECDGNHGIGRGNPAHTGCATTVTPPKDCKGVVNGTATAADCNPPKLCPNGSAMPASGNVADCNHTVICPAAGSMGPVPAGCSIGGGAGGPGTRPVTKPVTGHTVTPAKVVTPIAGTTPAPATALPFTGNNTGLLLEISLLMLLVGGGLTMATRKPRPAIALV